MPRYRVSEFEKMALYDLYHDNPYLWNRRLSGQERALYAFGWTWFKPMTRDQADLQSLYWDDAIADAGPLVQRFSLVRFLLAWGGLFTALYVIAKMLGF